MKRVLILTSYFLRELFRSLSGLLLIVAALVFYLVAILGVTGGVDRDYAAIMIGAFFALLSLLLALIIADRAHRSSSYLLLYRLPSRSAFLAAILLATVLTAGVLELVVALLTLPRLVTPLTAGMVMDILPVWISWLLLGAALGLNMSELARCGWSRTIIYAVLAFVLFVLNQQQTGVPVELSSRFSWIPHLIPDPARWGWVFRIVDLLIWPLTASIRVAREMPYTLLESFAPALSLLAAMALLGLAADLFGRKDLIFPES